jgi:hypothetical protein
MTNPISSASSSAIQGMQASLRKLDRAAATISRIGLDAEPGAPASPDEPPLVLNVRSPAEAESDLPAAMIDMMTAQRAYSLNLRVLETANEMAKESIDLGRHQDPA